jgi:hypothetical protein
LGGETETPIFTLRISLHGALACPAAGESLKKTANNISTTASATRFPWE